MMNQPTVTPALEEARRFLDIDATERETLLAALETTQALIYGDVIGARFLATAAYNGPALSRRMDALADRIFLVGVQQPAAITRVHQSDTTGRRATASAPSESVS